MAERLKSDTATIVVLGEFNPAIFHPQWFGRHELLRPAEVDEASGFEDLVVSNGMANFKVDWLEMQITPRRLWARALDASHFRPLRDLVAGMFQVQNDIPVGFMGLVRTMIRDVGSEEEFHQMGGVLAPGKVWKDVLGKPGLLSLEMGGEARTEDASNIRVQVRPAPSDNAFAISFEVREEYFFPKLDGDGRGTSAGLVSDILNRQWADFSEYADSAVDAMLERIRGGDDE